MNRSFERLCDNSFMRLSAFLLCLCSLTAAAAGSIEEKARSLADSYYHFSLAQMHYLDGDIDRSIEEYRLALESDPLNAGLRVSFAEVLLQSKRIEEGMEQCRLAIESEPEFADAHLLLGRALYGENQLEEAVIELRRAADLDSDQFMAHYYLGTIYMARERFEEAAQSFGEVLRLRPDLPQVYHLRADALTRLGRLDEASELFEDALRYNPDDYQAMESLAKLYESTNQIDKAIEAYRKILSGTLADPSALQEIQTRLAHALYSSGRLDEAVSLLSDLVESYPGNRALKSLYGLALTDHRRYGEAVDVFRSVLGDSPSPEENLGDLDLTYHLGRALAGMGSRAEAIDVFAALMQATEGAKSGAKLEYRNAARVHMGLLCQRERRYDQAIKLLEEARQAEPDDPRGTIRLAFALKEAGRGQEALDLSRALLAERPDPDVVMFRAQLLSESDRLDEAVSLLSEHIAETDDETPYVVLSQLYLDHGRYAEAEDVVGDALKQFSDSEALLFQLAAIYEQRKEFDRAEAEFKKLLDKNPQHYSALNYLGYMLADNGVQLQEALRYVQKAVDSDPFNGAFLDSLGWVYFRLGNFEQAERYLSQAIRINDTDPTIFEHLGDLYRQLRRFEKARESYESSLSFATEDEERERARGKLDALKDAHKNGGLDR